MYYRTRTYIAGDWDNGMTVPDMDFHFRMLMN